MRIHEKISEALLEFAEPLISMFDEKTAPEVYRPAFILAIVVWNSAILDESERGSTYLEKARKALRSRAELDLFEFLVRRKQSEFRHDRRLIGEFKVFRKNGEFRLRAAAHEPPPARG